MRHTHHMLVMSLLAFTVGACDKDAPAGTAVECKTDGECPGPGEPTGTGAFPPAAPRGRSRPARGG